MEVGRDYEGMVIKPPMEQIKSGKVFKPSSALRNKYWFIGIVTVILLYVIAIGTFFGIMYLVYMIAGNLFQWDTWFNNLWGPVNFWFIVVNLCWMIPGFIFVPVYLRSFEYSVRGESGESLPEIYVRKGIIDVTEKHVPLRTITNIASKTGPFDRLFGIGNVEIHTAGYSGGPYEGGKPEEKIEGIVFFQELRDFILQEMRKLVGTYALGTEVSMTADEMTRGGSVEDATLMTLREIRELLRRLNEKLDRGGL